MLSPLQCDMPMKTSDPMPAAMRPGIRIRGSVARLQPAASMMRTADTIGEPKMTETAAKAAGRREHGHELRLCVACRTRRTVYIARPAPSVMRGGCLIDEVDAVRVRATHANVGGAGASPLSPAELRLLPYLQTHLTIAQIAARLFVSRNTVNSEFRSIYRKLGVSSRHYAVQQATVVGLLGD